MNASASASLVCLGVGDGAVTADRNRSSYLYRFGDTQLLLDCGEPVSRTLTAVGTPPDAVQAVFLSHLHSDHVGGLTMLLQSWWLARRRAPLALHLPANAIDLVRTMMRTCYLFEELFQFEFTFHPLEPGKTVTLGPVRVTPYPTTHLENLRRRFQTKYPGDYHAYCFLIEDGSRRIGHSADLGAPKDLAPLLEGGLDWLICEMAHFPPEALFDFLRGRSVRRCVFTHLGQPMLERLEEIRQLAAKHLDAEAIHFPRDLDTFDL